MRHTPRGFYSLDWSKAKEWIPGKKVWISILIFFLVISFPLTRGVVQVIWNLLQTDWYNGQVTAVEVDIVPVEIPPRKNLAEHIKLNGNFEEIERWKIKVPDAADGVSPTQGFGLVLPPESMNFLRIEGNLPKVYSERPQFYCVPPDKTLTATDIENNASRQESSLASSLGSLPFEDDLYTGSPNACVFHLQGFANNRPAGLDGEAVFRGSWTMNERRLKKQPLEWKQWTVSLREQDAATFAVPEDGWRHLWIVPVNDPQFLPEIMGVPVPFGGFTQAKLDSLYVSVNATLLNIGYIDEEARSEIGRIQKVLVEDIHSNVRPHGPYLRIDGRATEPLTRIKTWSAAHNASMKGKTITLGLNVNKSAQMDEPIKVIVGVSRYD